MQLFISPPLVSLQIAPHLGRVDDVEAPLWLNGQAIAHRFAGIALDTPFAKAVSAVQVVAEEVCI